MNVDPLPTAAQQTGSLPSTGMTLLDQAKLHTRRGEPARGRDCLRRIARSDRDFRSWVTAAKLLEQLDDVDDGGRARVRVALIGTSTLDHLGLLLPVAGLAVGLRLDVFTGGFGQYESQVLDPGSALHTFAPDVVILAPDDRATAIPSLAIHPDEVLDAEVLRWTGIWQALKERTHARILQLNFVPPLERPLGSLEGTLPEARRTLVSELNRRLGVEATNGVHIVDAMALATEIGLRDWRDDRYWFHAKQPVALGALPDLAREIGAVLGAVYGRSRKVLVTDLDDTLWGGVVGEDGVGGLRLGGSAVGEAHLALQQYLLDLKSRGVLLAVCSKNDHEVARLPFTERNDMRLTLDDFAAFVANWKPKPENLHALAETLDLGLDAFVFVDDNPAEREIVRQQVPEVDVLDLPEDPSGFVRQVAAYRGFETVGLTAEDSARTVQYRARAQAHELRANSRTFEDYLRSLDMVAEFRDFTPETLQRVAQLVAKTNQWNMTSRRHSFDQLNQWACDPTVLTFSVGLEDRFVDHGLVAVVVAHLADSSLEIDTLLMSCRVIGRTLERTIFHELARRGRELGVRELHGIYVRTDKNSLVANTYGDLGFTLIEADSSGSRWRRSLEQSVPDQVNNFITSRIHT